MVSEQRPSYRCILKGKDNYDTWAEVTLTILDSDDCKDIVLGIEKEPKEVEPERDEDANMLNDVEYKEYQKRVKKATRTITTSELWIRCGK